MLLVEADRVELGGLQHLDLADEDVLERVDELARLLDFLGDGLGRELADDVLEGRRRDLSGDNREHAASDFTHLRGLGVRGLGNLVLAARGEADDEHTHDVAVDGLHFDVTLDGGLPLADERAQLVDGQVHPVERGEAVSALDVLNQEAHLAVRVVFALVFLAVLVLAEVSEARLNDTTLEVIDGQLCIYRKKITVVRKTITKKGFYTICLFHSTKLFNEIKYSELF